MSTSTARVAESRYSLEHHGIQNVNTVYWNLSTPLLYEEALQRHEGRVAHLGPLVVRTGQYTGRSPRDKFIVREPSSADQVWWGDVNRPMEPEQFDRLRSRLLAYLQDRDVFVQDLYWRAVAHYKATNDHTVLGKVAEELRNTYASSVWASKAIPWLH